jgi:hypothetical protein
MTLGIFGMATGRRTEFLVFGSCTYLVGFTGGLNMLEVVLTVVDGVRIFVPDSPDLITRVALSSKMPLNRFRVD